MQAPPSYQGSPPIKKPSYVWVWVIVGVIGVCGCGGILVLAAVLFPVFAQARLSAQRTQCLSNVKQMSTAALMYSTDNDGRLPLDANWMDGIERLVRSDRVLGCPVLSRSRPFMRVASGAYGYAVNKTTSGKVLANIKDPYAVIWVFESSDLRRNVSEDPAFSTAPNRHGLGRNVGYIDGHAKFIRPADSTFGSQ
jgi:prepilin-type processing-associated H-X9-DG protein